MSSGSCSKAVLVNSDNRTVGEFDKETQGIHETLGHTQSQWEHCRRNPCIERQRYFDETEFAGEVRERTGS